MIRHLWKIWRASRKLKKRTRMMERWARDYQAACDTIKRSTDVLRGLG